MQNETLRMEKLYQEVALGRMAGPSPIIYFKPTLVSHHVRLSNGILEEPEIRQQVLFEFIGTYYMKDKKVRLLH